MNLPRRLETILHNALDERAPTKEDCTFLLNQPEGSLGALVTAAVADVVSRRRFGNQAMLLGQIEPTATPGRPAP